MARIHLFALSAAVLPLVLALPSNIPIDIAVEGIEKRQYTEPGERAQAVVDAFKLSWEGYYKYAFPNDELKPVTNGFSNSRSEIVLTLFSPQSNILSETNGVPLPSTPSPPPS